ncbi:hypothetical protein [Streptomyces sp. MUSC 14]|uniref:hypothetical protein n=1 Tax=Streptomyces sp. MUSC 14 TaxID=1354889 RepID=UPI0011607D79|nr:hypothetical protein [Streptomyces sp. MUSC 14]
MDGMTIGDETVGAVFHSFGERCPWGVRALIDEANPYASEQQIESQSWSQSAGPAWLHPQYSLKSFRDGATASE